MGGTDTFKNIKLQRSNVNTILVFLTTVHSLHSLDRRGETM